MKAQRTNGLAILPIVLAAAGCILAMSGCGARHKSEIPVSGTYIDHMTGKSYALIFDATGVSAWENYGESGPGAKVTGPATCLSKGSKYTVNGQNVLIQGGTEVAPGISGVPFSLTKAPVNLSIAGNGFALQLKLSNGGKINFMKM